MDGAASVEPMETEQTTLSSEFNNSAGKETLNKPSNRLREPPPLPTLAHEEDEESKLWVEMGAVHSKSSLYAKKTRKNKKNPGTIKKLFGRGKNASQYAPITYSPVSPVREFVDEHFDNIIGEDHFEEVIGVDEKEVSAKKSPASYGREEMWIKDLDRFFTRLYEFYINQGFACVVGRQVGNLINILFTVGFSTFCFLFVDWSLLLKCNGTGDGGCGPFSKYIVSKQLLTVNAWHTIVYTYCFTFGVYWFWSLISFFRSLKQNWEIHVFVRDHLKIKTKELQTMKWSRVVEKVIELHQTGQIRINRNVLTAHDIASHIMRKENYMIALFNRNVLNLAVPSCLVACWGCIKALVCCRCCKKRAETRATYRAKPKFSIYLTHHLQWNLQFCILNPMFNQKYEINREFLERGAHILRRRFFWVGVANFILMPFTLIFMLVYFFMKHAEELHSKKDYLGPREWSPLGLLCVRFSVNICPTVCITRSHTIAALWKFREFNELPHLFLRRMNLSYKEAQSYEKQFPTPMLTVVSKCVTYIAGGLVALLAVFTLLDENILLHVTIAGRNLLWFAAILSTLLALGRGFMLEREAAVLDANAAMKKVVSHTHYMQRDWVGRCHTYTVRDEFLKLFRFKVELFLWEIISVILTPLLLWFSLPKCGEDIVNFVRDFTVQVDGLGSICGYALFDFSQFGDVNFGAPLQCPENQVSKDGKMEKSFLNFMLSNPNWRPDVSGSELVQRLNVYRAAILRERDVARAAQERERRSTRDACASSMTDSIFGAQSVVSTDDGMSASTSRQDALKEVETENCFNWIESYGNESFLDERGPENEGLSAV